MPSFSTLWSNYQSTRVAGTCSTYANQCAMRLGRALIASGIVLTGYGDPVCQCDGNKYPRGAESLANYLWNKIGPAFKYSATEARAKVRGRTGITFFRNLGGMSIDHIDLWDGGETKTGAPFDSATEVWFWKLD